MALQLVLTTAGRAALINAEKNGTNAVKVTSIGFTAAAFTATDDLKTVPGQHLTLSSISGGTTSSTTIHVSVSDTSRATYEVRGFGLYLDNGTLLGSYSQPELIMEKAAASDLLLSADILFSGVTVSSVTFGNANFINPAATTEKEGIVELATRVEAIAGTDAQRAVTPDALKAAIDSRSGCARFEASGTFAVPAGVTAIYVSACAGGGGGGGGGTRAEKSNGSGIYTATGGGGGGAGQSIQRVRFAVTPGVSHPIVIGAGGSAGAGSRTDGASGAAGSAGGATVIGNLITLAGGQGGGGGLTGANQVGGAAGGDGYPAGGDSASIAAVSPYGPAGTGGSCAFGGGGPGGRSAGDTTSASRKGYGFGAGGGGGGGVSNGAGVSTFGKDGAVGCPGFVFIEWC
ncbi:phage tail protein [Xanthomonas campestris]|uniref:glycine-rich domain-containing protein n=1 Tax=Xanthomonas campestris TaxID=339 RepID=UPI000E32533E|nr:phage tail protein [Xanthomonas campestris]MEA9842366.1 phage tail protein [Xanthomonas campestris pv. raphani]RFF69076.1 phage tail protein [Xanthomonas campestris pv. raphani]